MVVGTTYFALVPDDDYSVLDPSGLIRKIEGAGTLSFERATADGTWIEDPDVVSRFCGLSDDGGKVEIDEETADYILEKWRDSVGS